MTMEFGQTDDRFPRSSLGRMVATITTGARAMASTVGGFLKEAIMQTQIARMQSVLHAMSDRDLDLIGVTRSGIRKHAEFLVTGK